MDEREALAASKYLSLVLRHRPESAGVALDQHGWVEVDVLLPALARRGHAITRVELEQLVRESDKQRFALSADGARIRANQGHSLPVDVELVAAAPPPRLFHGTVARFLPSIRAAGLAKMERRHVHLSATRDLATLVGRRRGEPLVLVVDAHAMVAEGHTFYLSANGVWLTDHVPPRFILPDT
jgi:putative RNA 2'-phosphotransferase